MLNDMEDVVCERSFAPDLDLGKILKIFAILIQK